MSPASSTLSEPGRPRPEPANTTGSKTYGQILKSSALIGGSAVTASIFAVVRAKVMAVLLGPTGIGLWGIYNSIFDLTRSIAGLGVNTSGVRQIAEAVGSGDQQRIAVTVKTLRRVAFCSGALGALLLVGFSGLVSWWTFKDYQHTGAIALLALAVFFGDVSAGQTALVQGMRRIGDLARMRIWGAFFGTVFSIPIIYFYKENGVVPSLVCIAAMGVITSWWYARKIKVAEVKLTMRQVFGEASGLLKMGIVFMSASLMTMGTAYLVRIIILHKAGGAAAGYYQAAWALGGLYVGFVLQAMGSDFYPRLTAIAHNHTECNRLVNEQAEIGLLLAGPGILATLTFQPVLVPLFYSGEFGPTMEILRWICLGMMLRVASWPMGFILLARGERKLFFWTELLSQVAFLALAWIAVAALKWEITGVGIAFFGSYVIYWVGIYAVVRRLSGFRWSRANRQLALLLTPLIVAEFIGWYYLPPALSIALGVVVTLVTGIYSVRTLCTLIPIGKLPVFIQKALKFFRLAPHA